MVQSIDKMNYKPEVPRIKRPIVSIGAGEIVSDCHYPAYQLAGFEVIGIYDLKTERARDMAERFHVPQVCETLEQLVELASERQAIYDIAVPASAIVQVLRTIPVNSPVLIQKPMGENIGQAREILQLCRDKKLIAGINFQLRQAPYIIAAKKLIDEGVIGEVCDFEIRETVFTPWNLWDFLFKVDRMEINYHSIHFVDVMRYFLGNPKGVYCKTMKHPKMPDLAQVKSNMIFDYGDTMRAGIISNHNHEYGLEEQECFLKIEGTKGAIKVVMGVYLDYPVGLPDKFKYISLEDKKGWRELDIQGSWFPEAFIGTMGGLMKKLEDPSYHYINDVEDAYETMCLVEACYESSANGATLVEPFGLSISGGEV